MIPLLLYTVYWTIKMLSDFGPLSRFMAVSSICEVQRGVPVGEEALRYVCMMP